MAHAEDCKSFYTGSIPVPASKKNTIYKKKTCIFCFFGVNSYRLFQRSSVVEQSAVNRSVVGSSPTAGAIKGRSRLGSFFYALHIDELESRKHLKKSFPIKKEIYPHKFHLKIWQN